MRVAQSRPVLFSLFGIAIGLSACDSSPSPYGVDASDDLPGLTDTGRDADDLPVDGSTPDAGTAPVVDSAGGAIDALSPDVIPDPQTGRQSGLGCLRIVELDSAKREIHVRTYSPYLDADLTLGDNNFTLPLDDF
jgi:hypothetical protein